MPKKVRGERNAMTKVTPLRLYGVTQDRERLGRAVGLCLDWLH